MWNCPMTEVLEHLFDLYAEQYNGVVLSCAPPKA